MAADMKADTSFATGGKISLILPGAMYIMKEQFNSTNGIIMQGKPYRGKNRYEEFLAAARSIAKKISTIKGVVGIIATGGIGRGFCDELSDLDLIVYADEKHFKSIEKYIAVGCLRHKGIELDTPVENYQYERKQKSPSSHWTQALRWDRENSMILFDPQNKIKRLLKAKLVFADSEQKELLKKYEEAVNDYLIYHYLVWERRGHPFHLGYTLTKAAENFVYWLYAKNRKFQPYAPKWLFYYLENDLILESKHKKEISSLFTQRIETFKDAQAVRNKLVKICKKTGFPLIDFDIAKSAKQNKKNWEKASERTRKYLSW